MTPEEIKIGEQWIGILAKYASDFSTKSLFNSTSSFINQKGKGQKKFGLSQDSGKLAKDEKIKEQELENLSLMEAAKKRAALEEEPTNLLATSEDDIIPKKRKSKNV